MARIILLFTFGAACHPALGHQPTISDGTATGPDAAIVLEDIQLSRAIYHEVDDGSEQLWLKFDIESPQSLFVSIGVPFIDRLESFRPAFVVLGPGLPEIELPFEKPQDVGGLLFLTDDVDDPEVFDEPFSRTTSWILRETDVELPEVGTYYIVAYVPKGETGKLWLAPGDREEFSLGDIVELGGVVREVQAFHENTSTGAPCFIFPFVGLAAIPAIRLMRKRPLRPRVHRR